MKNILTLIKYFHKTYKNNSNFFTDSLNKNRIQSVGEGLEEYIKKLISESLYLDNERILAEYNKVFSYLGNKNNPPDLIIKGGDAFEIKKIENKNTSGIALNSSFPKSKLFNNDPLLTKACKECEKWEEKDIIYSIGNIDKQNLKQLWFVYGTCYAAEQDIYLRIKNTIKNSLENLDNIHVEETNEIGRVNKVDPLGITYLRIRGMWHISHPNKVFSYLNPNPENNILNVLILEEKFLTFSEEDRNFNDLSGVKIKDIFIKNPNNPADLIKCKYIFIER